LLPPASTPDSSAQDGQVGKAQALLSGITVTQWTTTFWEELYFLPFTLLAVSPTFRKANHQSDARSAMWQWLRWTRIYDMIDANASSLELFSRTLDRDWSRTNEYLHDFDNTCESIFDK
jgi:hypothetical protein